MPQRLAQVEGPVAQVDALLAHFGKSGGWIKGRYSNNNGGYCLMGGLETVRSGPADRLASVAVRNAIGELYPRFDTGNLPVFNDAFFTGRRRVKKVLLRARQILQQQEAAAAANESAVLQKAA